MSFVIFALIFHWYLSLFCQTFYLHRYISHSMYKLSNFWNRFFCILTIVSQGPSFLRPQNYKVLHLLHHAHSDQEKDPHSPVISKNLVTMMLKTFNHYKSVKTPPEDFPLLVRIADHMLVRVLFGLFYVLLYLKFTDSYLYLVFTPIHFFMGPIQGAVVNWAGHKYGYTNYELGDNSKNTLPVDLFLMGELHQNNHHAFPKDANFSKKIFEFDPTFVLIRLFRFLGVLRYDN